MIALALLVAVSLLGGPGPGPGRGSCPGGGRGQMTMRDADHGKDHADFMFLLDHREDIRRTVTMRKDGVETVTESDDPAVTERIRVHVAAMYSRLDEGRPIHARDPLFAEIFRNHDKIDMTMENTEKGLRVVETSKDPYVAKLIQQHARVLDAFLANGHEEVMKNHALPEGS